MDITYIGLDVHTTNHTICAYTIENDKTFAETTINPDIRELDKYLKKIQEMQGGCKLVRGYEAGCLGYLLYQQLTAKGYECIILAPTTMLKTAKEIKTVKRDARKIAKCLAFGTYSRFLFPTMMLLLSRNTSACVMMVGGSNIRIRVTLHSFLIIFFHLHLLHFYLK